MPNSTAWDVREVPMLPGSDLEEDPENQDGE